MSEEGARRQPGQELVIRQSASPLLSAKFLSSLDQRTVNTILAAAKSRQFSAKRRLLTAGQPATHLFMLRTGRVRYYKTTKSGDEIVLHVLAAGDVFGLGTLLKHPTNYMASAEAISDCNLLIWEHPEIRKLADAYPQLAENALRIVLQYLRSYVNRHVGLVSKTAKQRLAITLLDLGRRTGEVQANGVRIDATNEQLSGLADISRFTTGRLLKQWTRSGALSKGRAKVVIHAPEALTAE